MNTWLARDFVETREGFFFAVVATGVEEGRVLAFLRYVRENGALRKVDTPEAGRRVRHRHPEYVFHSSLRDVDLHGVPVSRVLVHHQPRARAAVIAGTAGLDRVERNAERVIRRFTEGGIPLASLGVTGSLLVRAHTRRSDIDLVVYDRTDFGKARRMIESAAPDTDFRPLDEDRWREAFNRRACSLSFEEYVWHERRKHNKVMIDYAKVDVSMVAPDPPAEERWRKIAPARIRARVSDDAAAFDYPARYRVEHAEIAEVVSYTNTYTGQARHGETIEAAGWKERSDAGGVRLLVGTSREAAGEYIKVLRGCDAGMRNEHELRCETSDNSSVE